MQGKFVEIVLYAVPYCPQVVKLAAFLHTCFVLLLMAFRAAWFAFFSVIGLSTQISFINWAEQIYTGFPL